MQEQNLVLSKEEYEYLTSVGCGSKGFRDTEIGRSLYEKGFLDGVGRSLPKTFEAIQHYEMKQWNL